MPKRDHDDGKRKKRIRKFTSPAEVESRTLNEIINKHFSNVIEADKDLTNYWGAASAELSSDAYMIARSSVVHYVGNPVAQDHRQKTKYTAQTLFNRCNQAAYYAGWEDEVPFELPPWPIPETVAPPWIDILYKGGVGHSELGTFNYKEPPPKETVKKTIRPNDKLINVPPYEDVTTKLPRGIAVIRGLTKVATKTCINRGIIWSWFNGRGPWEGKERDKIRKLLPSYRNTNLGRIMPHIIGWVAIPEDGLRIFEYRFDAIRGGVAYGNKMVKIADLGPGILHVTLQPVRRQKGIPADTPNLPKFFQKFIPGKHAPLPSNWFANPPWVGINKDTEKTREETKKKMDELRKRRKESS